MYEMYEDLERICELAGVRNREAEIELERKVALMAVKGLLKAGFGVGVHDGEATVLKNSFDESAIMNALGATDEEDLIAYKDGKRVGRVNLIWGNLQDVINDYSSNLEDALKDALEFAYYYGENIKESTGGKETHPEDDGFVFNNSKNCYEKAAIEKCPRCKGTGSTFNKGTCHLCNGQGEVWMSQEDSGFCRPLGTKGTASVCF